MELLQSYAKPSKWSHFLTVPMFSISRMLRIPSTTGLNITTRPSPRHLRCRQDLRLQNVWLTNIRRNSTSRSWTDGATHSRYRARFVWSYRDLLTYWGRVTHICIGKLTIIGSDNDFSPGQRQAIIWTNAGLLLIGPLRTNFSEIISEIHSFSFKKMHLKMASAKWRPFCFGLNVLDSKIQPPGVGIPIIKIRRFYDHLIFIMGILMLFRGHLLCVASNHGNNVFTKWGKM